MDAVETYQFGYYSVKCLNGRRLRLLCSQCAESHSIDEEVRFLDPVLESDPHTDCADCGIEAVFGRPKL